MRCVKLGEKSKGKLIIAEHLFDLAQSSIDIIVASNIIENIEDNVNSSYYVEYQGFATELWENVRTYVPAHHWYDVAREIEKTFVERELWEDESDDSSEE